MLEFLPIKMHQHTLDCARMENAASTLPKLCCLASYQDGQQQHVC